MSLFSTDTATPMLAHYLKIKRSTPSNTLLLYRMGDFYELFFDDAITAAGVLDIALTHRGRHQGKDVPMCGVPVHARDAYIARLVRRGCRVAVCEQMETPAEARKRSRNALVRREVVRIITPGTLVEEELLPSHRSNTLLAVWGTPETPELGLAWADISTGESRCRLATPREARNVIARIFPQEILFPQEHKKLFGSFAKTYKSAITPLPANRFRAGQKTDVLGDFAGDTWEKIPFLARRAYGALIFYVQLTHVGKGPKVRPPISEGAGRYLALDAATRQSLELTSTLSGRRSGSLLGVLDETVTGAGARLLAHRLGAPLVDKKAICRRQEAVVFFQKHEDVCHKTRALLRQIPDMARALARLSLMRPRDLGALRDGLQITRALGGIFKGGLFKGGITQRLPEVLLGATKQLFRADSPFIDELQNTLCKTLPVHFAPGEVIASGMHGALDALKKEAQETQRRLLALQAFYAQHTGLRTLKVRHNTVLGFYLETPLAGGKKLLGEPWNQTYIHRQTLRNSVRFTTQKIEHLAGEIFSVRDKAAALEREIFENLVKTAQTEIFNISQAAHALAEIDVYASLAFLAHKRDYVCPKIEDSCVFEVVQGRHAVVEALSPEPFIPNDCVLNPETRRILLMTAPNMAGKSTFLRQNALLVILAQMGSFVPARKARIGVVDQLFSRVGAADDLAAGRSTFMVEMTETVAILNRAKKRSFVILDEVGRGTATFDGLALAWAVLERLHEVNKCRTLFSTHYHELTELSLNALERVTLRVEEHKKDIIFLHEVVEGCADHSYGLYVAALAGLPPETLERAKKILAHLNHNSPSARNLKPQPTPQPTHEPTHEPSPLSSLLAQVDPDTLTPRAALDLVYKLKREAR